MNARVDRQENVGSLLRRIFAQDAVDRAFRITSQVTNTRFSAQILVHDFFDVRFPFHVSLVKREFLRVLFIDIVWHADITQKMRGKRAVNVGTHRFDREFHSRQSDIMLGKFRQSWEIDVLDVGKWNLGIIAIVFLQPARVIIAGKIEVVEPWDDPMIDDPDDVRFLQVFRHSIDGRSILVHGGLTKAFAIAFDHFRQVKIDLITSHS